MPIIDITVHPAHDNSGYSFDSDELAILFDYVDAYADDTEPPTIMLAILYPHGLDRELYCEHGHDVAPGQPIIDIPDRTHCFMCPAHFHDSSVD
jgi:hypothetical protein